jgi:predicted RecA/RadA family phage recombinase
MKNYIQPGDVITVAAPADVASGDLVVVGDIVGVAAYSALSGAQVEIKTSGVFELKKVSAQAWATVGLPIYVASGEATSAKSTNKLIGVNVATAANPSGTGFVRLNGAFAITSSGS